MPADLDNSSSMAVSTGSGEASVSSSGDQPPPPKATTPAKKKRNLPGMPDPDAEVIALSPKTLLATNRFVCEICNKGFQRDQNLQLHRRGHNLPWKLRQRSSKEVRKRVYVCPEPSCVHHDPSRALGDLTGIKKHFCRKHGEKKWKCDKCSKKYAVQSDWKAHSKICGTREYKRDSFITHRAFCDALAEESARNPTQTQTQTQTKTTVNPNPEEDRKIQRVSSSPPTLPPPAAPAAALPPSSSAVVPAVLPIQSPASDFPENSTQILEDAQASTCMNGSCSSSTSSSSSGSTTSTVFASLFASSTASAALQHPTPPTSLQPPQTTGFSDLIQATADHPATSSAEPISLCLSTNHAPIFGTAGQECRQYAPPLQPVMSATALLQKAAQMGAAATNASLLRGFGIVSSSSSSSGPPENFPWNQQMEHESAPGPGGLGLGLPSDGGSGLKDVMLGATVFGSKRTTLDLLGLGIGTGIGGSPAEGLSALITSIGGGLDVAAAAAATSLGSGEFSGKEMGRRS
ncbi:zinc finger protein GAI-ASSOCIATED FACTOR 1-like isoform X2 [Malania oleifera]|uniref:zinc finger protein GAI-ASSOCIATED FACTOR 1-like isoform X2 n=1 Tax=Malania oleifera TaxID=397392 RepID=UPI0025AE9000|nr:zinc finger protein GAI-ASSOCIATED FACTOR 1-like isoform X2 [Malania oleifera]